MARQPALCVLAFTDESVNMDDWSRPIVFGPFPHKTAANEFITRKKNEHGDRFEFHIHPIYEPDDLVPGRVENG